MNAYLKVEHRHGVDWLTLNRPEKLNAIRPEMAYELQCYFDNLLKQPQVRAVVMSGAGRNFCAGFDLDCVDRLTASLQDAAEIQKAMSNVIRSMRACPQPIVALVSGAACGAGFALALAADVRYASLDARMNVAMARVGLTGCDMGISYFLPRAVGRSHAAELMMGGRFVDADRAHRIGLVSGVYEPAGLQRAAEELTGEMVAMSPLGLRLTKEGLTFGLDAASLEEVLAMEDRGQVMCIGLYMREGVAAFKAKRKARYVL